MGYRVSGLVFRLGVWWGGRVFMSFGSPTPRLHFFINKNLEPETLTSSMGANIACMDELSNGEKKAGNLLNMGP